MRTTRRTFIQTSALAGAGLLVSGRRVFGRGLDPIKNLRKFVAALPGLGPTGIPVATPDTSMYPGVDYYKIVMGQYQQQMHPDLPPTTLWGYADATSGPARFRYLGPAVVATSGRPVRVKFGNGLPLVHPLPIDHSIPGAEKNQPDNRACAHLHGGFVAWASDGNPFAWSAPDGSHGPSRVAWLLNDKGHTTDENWYPNAQSARLMWYHDHALGITRLNAYAGLAAPYVLIDTDELGMFGSSGTVLPNQVPGIPLVLQDKSFKNVRDKWGNPGDLWYPSVGEQDADFPGGKPAKLPSPSCVPEFFGDTIVINGMAFPELTLKPGLYRFRMLNGTQSRVFNLQLYHEDTLNAGEPNLAAPGPNFIQIGTEGGFLPQPAVVPSGHQYDRDKYLAHDSTGYSLVLGGAERADVIIDFSASANASFVLYNDAAAPFPDGDAAADYFTGSPDNPASGPLGYGPNTRTMMRIRITNESYSGPTAAAVLAALYAKLPTLTSTSGSLLVPDALIGSANGLTYPGATSRLRTLNEGWDQYGRLIQMLGTSAESRRNYTVYGMEYVDAVLPEEACSPGDVQIWDIYNTTGDTHPIHFHLVNVQILGRAPFTLQSDGTVIFTPAGSFVPPDTNERGSKETVRMNPNEVTRVIMRFDLPPDPVVNGQAVTVPQSPRTGGFEYVWHCHILEHEEHDMMRPLIISV